MPYKYKPLNKIIDEKCFGCRFYVWDNERHEYGCMVYGCIDYSNYQEFQGIYSEDKGWE